MILSAAMIVRNESERYLDKILTDLKQNVDQIIILDDASTDNTVEICKSYDAEVYTTEEPLFWKAENHLRFKLWTEILPRYEHDWILAVDADEMMESKFWDIKDNLLEIEGVNQFSARVVEFWGNMTHFRADGYWNPTHVHTEQGWQIKQETSILARWMPQVNYMWSPFRLHCGRLPMNQPGPVMSCGCFLKHYGWSDSSKHREKYDRYMENDPNPHPAMVEHYQSILEDPTLIKWWGE